MLHIAAKLAVKQSSWLVTHESRLGRHEIGCERSPWLVLLPSVSSSLHPPCLSLLSSFFPLVSAPEPEPKCSLPNVEASRFEWHMQLKWQRMLGSTLGTARPHQHEFGLFYIDMLALAWHGVPETPRWGAFNTTPRHESTVNTGRRYLQLLPFLLPLCPQVANFLLQSGCADQACGSKGD